MIRHILFDLDNTLYDHPEHRDEMDGRIERFFQEKLRLDPKEAHETRIAYRNRYGTALRGLMIHRGFEPGEFLDYVHRGLPKGAVAPWPGAREVLEGAGLPLSVFSNAPEGYVRRMLEVLGLSDLFGRVFGIESTGYVGKPGTEAYESVLRALGLSGPECLLVEDMAYNLGPAKALGMTTVFLGKDDPPPERRAAIDFHVRTFSGLKDTFMRLKKGQHE